MKCVVFIFFYFGQKEDEWIKKKSIQSGKNLTNRELSISMQKIVCILFHIYARLNEFQDELSYNKKGHHKPCIVNQKKRLKKLALVQATAKKINKQMVKMCLPF